MSGERCDNCGGVIQTSRSKCPTCGYQAKLDAVNLIPSAETIRGWFSVTREPALSSGMFYSTVGVSSSGSIGSESPPKGSTKPSEEKSKKVQWGKGKTILFVTTLVLCVLLLVGGYYAIRVNRIFNTINSVSAPTGEISGEALGGSGDIKIDTGPAMTAVANGSNALSPSEPDDPNNTSAALIAEPPKASMRSTDESTVEPSASEISKEAENSDTTSLPAESTATSESSDVTTVETVIPAATEVPTEVPTATATPEPTVVLSEIERIINGSFEAGNDGSWYLSDSAGIDGQSGKDSAGALTIGKDGGYADQRLFFVTGTEYRVSAWVKLDRKPANDEAVQIGITYRNEAGERLTDLEPTAISITDTDWSYVQFDYAAPPEASEVKLFFWKVPGKSSLAVDDVSVRSIVPEEALNTEIIKSDAGSMTVLIMGVDARPGEAIDIGVRPDSLMVLHLDGNGGACRILSIPRDTRTELPGYGMTKINHALAVGGIQYEIQVVENLLGIQIDHYVLIDFSGFKDLVDAVGGITVEVPEAFENEEQQFNVGTQSMSGVQALAYARWRGGSDGDFGRMQRQQLIIRALVSKVYGLNIVNSINELLPAVEDNLRTDLSPSDMASMASDYRSSCNESNITMVHMEGSAATYQDPLLQLPLYYIELEPAEIRQKVAELLEP